jgi:hypothetical protein
MPRLGRRESLAVTVEGERCDVEHGRTVGHRVVDTPDDADPPVLEAGGEGDLPERTRAVERRREERVAQLAEPPERQRLAVERAELDDVGIELERGVVDPVGLAEPERMKLKELATAGHVPQA